MKVYIKFLISIFSKSLFYVISIMFSLIFILNLLTELEFFKELYKRFIIPFYILLLSLVPLLLIILSKEDSRYSKLKLITFLIGLFFIIFSETTIRLISDSLIRNIVISLLPIVFIITLYLIFVKKFNYKYSDK